MKESRLNMASTNNAVKSQDLNPAPQGLEEFVRGVESGFPSWLTQERQAAFERLKRTGFPTDSWEEWRFTDISPLLRLPITQAPANTAGGAEVSKILSHIAGARDGSHVLVFVNGRYSEALSSFRGSDNLPRCGSLREALSEGDEDGPLRSSLIKAFRASDEPFVNLNAAVFSDGAFVHVPKDYESSIPLHLVFLTSESYAGATSSPRNVIIGEPGSSATVVEHYLSLGDAAYFTNAFTQILLAENAVLRHCKMQEESAAAFHIASTNCIQGAGSKFSSYSVSLGARLSKSEVNVALKEHGAECKLGGLYMVGGKQLTDHHTRIEHEHPGCRSEQRYHGILSESARGVFTGRVVVNEGAFNTDARQINRNLLLSDDARVNAKPLLEIFADDVKCAHAATIGQLDEDSLFYLRARGIPLENARRMLVHGFASEIIDRIPDDALKQYVGEVILGGKVLKGGFK
ncbi:MAG: Fe-S cluster assembly protein SufD [Verrucomicrobia bacterium]|nr:Fe-S cluster assembly protein SufD [Verrucomicrobiota bacterium]